MPPCRIGTTRLARTVTHSTTYEIIFCLMMNDELHGGLLYSIYTCQLSTSTYLLLLKLEYAHYFQIMINWNYNGIFFTKIVLTFIIKQKMISQVEECVNVCASLVVPMTRLQNVFKTVHPLTKKKKYFKGFTYLYKQTFTSII